MSAAAYHAGEWPHGLLCAICAEEFTEGQPIAKRLEAVQGDVPVVLLTCVACDLTGAREDAP